MYIVQRNWRNGQYMMKDENGREQDWLLKFKANYPFRLKFGGLIWREKKLVGRHCMIAFSYANLNLKCQGRHEKPQHERFMIPFVAIRSDAILFFFKNF